MWVSVIDRVIFQLVLQGFQWSPITPLPLILSNCPTMSGSAPLEQPNRLKLSRQCLKLSKILLSLKNLTRRNYKNRICMSNIISEGLEHSWFTTWPPYTEGKETPKKEAENSRLVCGRLNKQGNLPERLVLGSARRVDLCTHLPESPKFI